MNDGKIIIDKIISDAEKIASVTIAQAQKEVDALLKAAQDNGLTVLSSPLSAFEICVAIARFVEEMET